MYLPDLVAEAGVRGSDIDSLLHLITQHQYVFVACYLHHVVFEISRVRAPSSQQERQTDSEHLQDMNVFQAVITAAPRWHIRETYMI